MYKHAPSYVYTDVWQIHLYLLIHATTIIMHFVKCCQHVQTVSLEGSKNARDVVCPAVCCLYIGSSLPRTQQASGSGEPCNGPLNPLPKMAIVEQPQTPLSP
jgi:hypothetical protein